MSASEIPVHGDNRGPDTGLRTPMLGQYAEAALSPLEDAATDWLDGFYQLEHLLCTRAWVMRLAADATPELKFAALVHDAERFFPGGPPSTPETSFDDPDYLFAHSIRSADFVEAWLREKAPPQNDSFVRRVRQLVLRHEIGGDREADVLQAADSLSFLETYDWLVVEWVRTGRCTIERAREKLDWMVERMRPPEAMGPALALYAHALRGLDDPYDDRVESFDFAKRRLLAGSRDYLLGLKTST